METNLINNYVLKAIDAYPYELEEVAQNLQYALSHNQQNAYALYLMGKLYAEQFADYEMAKEYFAEALSAKINFPQLYPSYINTLLDNEDFEEAKKLIAFAFSVKGVNKPQVYRLLALKHEKCNEYPKAIKAIKKAKQNCSQSSFIIQLDEDLERIKNKVKPKAKNLKTNSRK